MYVPYYVLQFQEVRLTNTSYNLVTTLEYADVVKVLCNIVSTK